MNLIFSTPNPASTTDRTQGRLLRWAALFLILAGAVLTLSPAARAHTWEAPLRWNHWLGIAVWFSGFTFIHRTSLRLLPERDPYLIPAAALLSGWGLLSIWRLSPGFGLRQTLWLAVCLVGFGLALRLPDLPQRLRRYKYIWLITGLLLLGLTFLFGTYPDGSVAGPKLWLGVGGVFVQPSEPLKLLLIVYLSAYLADNLRAGIRQFRALAPSFIVAAIALLLLLAQYDLGTAALFFVLFTVILYVATEKKRYAAINMVALSVALAIGYQNFDVVRLRIDAWINPWLDAGGRSYQIVQSLIAIASGELLGRGPGMGSPTLVPVTHSDFIFAAIAEEYGLLGIIALVAVLSLFAFRGLRTALRASDPYHRLVAAGLTSYITAQSLLIIGGNLRLLPLTGVTLPFVSYGGSSLVTTFIALLLLVQISAQPGETTPIGVNARPLLHLGAAFLGGLAGVALLGGWWSIVRAANLTGRNDNLRPAISEFYTPRGDILDRHGEKISTTRGGPGEYTRVITYPALSPVVGYANLTYGQTGLEASLNTLLRGLERQPFTSIWLADLLYGQSPSGIDVRLTLDLQLQAAADNLLDGHKGSAVLVNAQSGEILAMASHPGFDANLLDEDWDELIADPSAPLLNRASAGQYPLGAALGPFLLASSNLSASLPNVPQPLSATLDGVTIECSLPQGDLEWGAVIAAGCPTPVLDLANRLGTERVEQAITSFGLTTAPDVPLLTADPADSPASTDPLQTRLGATNLHVSPLQVALAASAISAAGQIPAAQIVNAYRAAGGSWDILDDPVAPRQALASGRASQAARMLNNADMQGWGSIGQAVVADNQVVTWFIAGTLPGWGGSPLALAVVIEEDDPDLAREIGQRLLETAMLQ